MRKSKKALLMVACILMVAVSWLIAATSKSDEEKQEDLVAAAQAYLDDEIHIKAVPLLEDAITFDTEGTLQAEEILKKSYLFLQEQSGYRGKYTDLLDRQMAREDATPAVFMEAAKYYMERSREDDAFEILKDGIKRTNDNGLINYYESIRYQYNISFEIYEDVTEFQNGMIAVAQDGKWGMATAEGSLQLPYEYDRISTYYNGELIALKNNTISGIDINGNRVALYKEDLSAQFTNYNEDRLAIKQKDGWHLATGELYTGTAVFQEIGTFSSGGAAAKVDNKWGVVDTSGQEWIIEPTYDGIICDTLGRCLYEGAVFVKQNGEVFLLVDGERVGTAYDDAYPFAGDLAAVKKDGKWGYIDREGNEQIPFRYEEAGSFSEHLAPVKQEDRWGYISLSGEMVIAPIFWEARAFSDGTAPVKTDNGWRFITLIEYADRSTGLL